MPATTQLEHLDLAIAWGHLYLALNPPAIEPVGQALPNTEIFRRLAQAMGLEDPALQDSDEVLVEQLLEGGHPWLAGIDLASLREASWQRLRVPKGHRPYVDDRPATDDGRLQLGRLEYRPGSETITSDESASARYPLTLLSRKQHTRFLNANYGGFAKHLPTPAEPRIELHATDAALREIDEGTRVRVFNDRGALTLSATISACRATRRRRGAVRLVARPHARGPRRQRLDQSCGAGRRWIGGVPRDARTGRAGRLRSLGRVAQVWSSSTSATDSTAALQDVGASAGRMTNLEKPTSRNAWMRSARPVTPTPIVVSGSKPGRRASIPARSSSLIRPSTQDRVHAEVLVVDRPAGGPSFGVDHFAGFGRFGRRTEPRHPTLAVTPASAQCGRDLAAEPRPRADPGRVGPPAARRRRRNACPGDGAAHPTRGDA